MKVPQKPRWLMWDHNIHYHPFLLRYVPAGARKALDVGCGAGLFAARVAERVPEVIAIDRNSQTLRDARERSLDEGTTFVEGDLFDVDLPDHSFDFISCLSALHHMPLRPALERFASLLAPGGVIAVLGHYKVATPFDYAYVGVTGGIDLAVGAVRHRTQAEVRRSQGIVADWHDSLDEIRSAAREVLPGARVTRHMYDRFSLLYSRPA